MRVLVYNGQSGEYFQAPTSWTRDPHLAYDFGGTVRAAEAVCSHRLDHAEIILAFDEPHVSDMRLPTQHRM